MQTQTYNLQTLLGQGGMAKVYLAEHKTLGHKVAIKVLNKEYVHNENIRKRFLAEAKNLAKMNHPHVVRVMDLIEEGEMVAFVMEYIDGQTLRDYLDQKGKLPDNEIKKLFGQMLEAVGYVHEQGLVHRDIKPSNFMLDSRGNIKLLDFGIAKTMDASSAEYTQTATSQHMGTPMYMSPEQVKSTKDVTAQSDIYSLGVVLWQMAAGRKPYDTNTLSTFEVQVKIVNEQLPETHGNWDDIIRKATVKDLRDRFLRIHNGKLDEPVTERSKQTQTREAEKTVVQTNFSQKVEIQPPPPKRDKIFSETIKDPNEKEPFRLEPWVVVLLVLGLIIVIAFFSNSGSEQTSTSDIEETKNTDRPLSDTAALNEILKSFVLVEGGSFKMGCITGDTFEACQSDQFPIRDVTLSSYYITKYEVTQYQWESIMGSIPAQLVKCQSCPIEGVSRAEIDSFIKKLNDNTTGSPIDLPTEAQWEFAAKGGVYSKKFFYSGSNSLFEVGWVGDTNSTYQPVGLKKPNELGIYDMTGNIYELCKDWYGEYIHDQTYNPNGPENGSNFVMRGGSFYHNFNNAGNSYRALLESNGKGNLIGFRLVVNPEIENSTDSTAAAH